MFRRVVPMFFFAACASAPPSRGMDCTFIYGGEATTTHVAPTDDPYTVKPVQFGERLAYKVVYVAAPEGERVVAIYTYALADTGPVLIHQAKYTPPFPDGPAAFTGVQTVFEPRNASDLTYTCRWAR